MSDKYSNLTQDLIKRHFNYDPETGIFTRKFANANCSKVGEIAGGKDDKGYIRIRINGSKYRAHTLAWIYMYGEIPKQIDHINGIKDDNRICNLRIADNFINSQNKHTKPKSNKTGYFGVHFDNGSRKFRARISHKGKSIHLGLFNDPSEAEQAYLKEKRKIHEGFTL
jgi:hypothetical protein